MKKYMAGLIAVAVVASMANVWAEESAGEQKEEEKQCAPARTLCSPSRAHCIRH